MAEQIRNLADVEAIESRSLAHLGLADNIYEAIRASAQKHPDRVALYGLKTGAADDAQVAMTFAEYLDQLHRMANLLNRLGVGPDDAVTLLLPITIDAVVALWAAACAGISNPVNTFLEIDHLEAIARAAGTKVVMAWHPSISPDSWDRGIALKQRLPEVTLIQCAGDGDVGNGVVCLETALIVRVSSIVYSPNAAFDSTSACIWDTRPGETPAISATLRNGRFASRRRR